ncbi:MAG: hypothetical protein AB7T48_01510 [Solirubrobacterales bacterium]
MASANRTIVAILVVAALAIGFWMLLLGPKREEANELGTQVEALELTLSEAQSNLAAAEAAKREFPADYRQLVVLGQAVPEGDETSSLLVELNQMADGTELDFDSFVLSGSGETAPVAPTPAPTPTPAPEAGGESSAVPAAATVPPTEAAAALLPLGATVGPAGLAVMPYNLSFRGDFFQVADFIAKLDSLVKTTNARVMVDGRLMTIGGFSLSADPVRGFPDLNANFAVTTYVTPPTEGVTAGATPSAPATPAAAEAAPAGSADAETSQTVSER